MKTEKEIKERIEYYAKLLNNIPENLDYKVKKDIEGTYKIIILNLRWVLEEDKV